MHLDIKFHWYARIPTTHLYASHVHSLWLLWSQFSHHISTHPNNSHQLSRIGLSWQWENSQENKRNWKVSHWTKKLTSTVGSWDISRWNLHNHFLDCTCMIKLVQGWYYLRSLLPTSLVLVSGWYCCLGSLPPHARFLKMRNFMHKVPSPVKAEILHTIEKLYWFLP